MRKGKGMCSLTAMASLCAQSVAAQEAAASTSKGTFSIARRRGIEKIRWGGIEKIRWGGIEKLCWGDSCTVAPGVAVQLPPQRFFRFSPAHGGIPPRGHQSNNSNHK